MESRNLLASIHACVTDISGIKLVKTYSLIKEETEVLLQDAVTIYHPPGYELHNAGMSCICSDSCMGFVVLNVYCISDSVYSFTSGICSPYCMGFTAECNVFVVFISYSIYFFTSGAEQSRPLQLELRQTSPETEEVSEEIPCPKRKLI